MHSKKQPIQLVKAFICYSIFWEALTQNANEMTRQEGLLNVIQNTAIYFQLSNAFQSTVTPVSEHKSVTKLLPYMYKHKP